MSLGQLNDAPFGGVLRFKHDDSYFIPKADSDLGPDNNSISFYRYSYRRSVAAGEWTAMATSQHRWYRTEYNDARLPTYEKHPIDPQTVEGEPNLFAFTPRTQPGPGDDSGNVVVREWLTGNITDVAASWDTTKVAPAMDSVNATDSAGTFDVKIEVFDSEGNLVAPGPDTFEFLAVTSDTTKTRTADPATEIREGGFVFKVHVDNNTVQAHIPQPMIGATQASDDCGFLRYDAKGTPVHLEFVATHPNDRAVFNMTVKRGSNPLTHATTAGPYTETAATVAPPYAFAGGVYQADFPASVLVEPCESAAFVASLTVFRKVTNDHGVWVPTAVL